MLFGIAIVVLAIVIAVMLNKSKISQTVHEFEQKVEDAFDKTKQAVAPAVAEVKQVVTKVAEVAPENKTIAETKVAVGTVVAAIEAKHAKKRGPKPGNKADTQKTSNNKPKSKK
jgi:DNA-binding protein H-NS